MKVQAVHRAGQLTAGPWGPHTSSIDWCEDNYINYHYLAEFYNSISNIPFILLGIHGVLYTAGLPHRTRFALTQAGVTVIGIGSFIFHATLSWHAQVLMDELPMVFVSSLALYCLVASDQSSTSALKKRLVAVGIALVPICISALYLAYPNPAIHQICYALIQIASAVRTQQLYASKHITPTVTRQAKSLMQNGSLIFLLGFAIWNIDNIFCDGLTTWRNSVSPALGWLSQGHAWWHLLTGLGASRIIVGVTYLTLSIEYPGQIDLETSFGFLPYVRYHPIATETAKGNGVIDESKKTA